ncbi:MAG: hypothetical protein HOL07_06545 [Rhodospirillaceae bacterium]|jgi:hypothetical protein|nr:hypothetical protein [Rhodospirillaceae bacterium]MBT3808985.1 hypothetical protein [Rhodospirillaceae bacterium]MBT3931738.1 hypothetical protein [Rhodospirillaceae bacterium]MBT4773549.1 hypothetical protein [Rhodospirillaceae bacterium]MBT5357992.1 hypothetical protein [Rhodospirillaceae bacterium]
MRIAIIGQPVRSELQIALARHWKETLGAELSLYGGSEKGLETYRALAPDLFDRFVVAPSPYFADAPEDGVEVPDDETIVTRALDYEERFGVPLNWLMTVDRVHGLGYSPGGFYFPRSYGEAKVSQIDVLRGYLAFFEFWDRELVAQKFDVLINGYNFEYFPCLANDTPMRTLTSARNGNFYFWSHSCFGELDGLDSAYLGTSADAVDLPDTAAELKDAPVLNRKQLDALRRRGRVISLLPRIYRILRNWALRQIGPDVKKRYKLSSELRYAFTEWWSMRRLRRSGMPTAAELAGRKYLFYALQVEPEQNFQGFSPEYFYQQSAIISLSRDLPPDTVLAVKEHIPAMNRRPKQFYEQLRLLKNVVLVDPKEDGLTLVKGARAVATINGTVGQEAAVLGIPVLSFGRRNHYNVVDHVKVVTDEAQIAPALRWALSDDFDRAAARVNGARYLSALRSLSVDMADFGYHNRGGFDETVIREATAALLRSLDLPAAQS